MWKLQLVYENWIPYYFNENQYYFHSKDFEKNFQ